MRRCLQLLVVAVVGLAAVRAMAGDEPPEKTMSDARGVIYLVDGVGGFGFAPKVMERMFADAEVPHETRHFQWSHGFGRWHADLTNDENLIRKGSELADAIMEYRVRKPGRPVFIVAKSGGTAVALRALAELPANSVERVVLLSSAVSPKYDMTPALRAVRDEIVSFWSPNDKLILGLGTTLFGTADGVQGDAAGLVSFSIPDNADAETRAAYRRLRQVEWDPEMKKTYNYGTHVGTSMPMFVKRYVAPLVGGRTEPEPPIVVESTREQTTQSQRTSRAEETR